MPGDWGQLTEPIHGADVVDPEDPQWRENAFLAFFDPAADVYGVVHLMTAANAGGRRLRCSLRVGDRQLELVEPLAPMSFKNSVVDFDLSGHVVADTEAFGFDLYLEPTRVIADYTQAGLMPGAPGRDPLNHVQQSGRARGVVRVGDTTLEIDGRCWRDRTWGHREEKVWGEYYGVFAIFDDFDLFLAKFSGTGVNQAVGFKVDRQARSVSEATVRRRDASGGIRDLWVAVAGGEEIELEMSDPRARMFAPMGDPDGAVAMTVYDDFVEFRTRTGITGFGFVEQGILRRQT
jgi:hypothetical protein